jgi:methionyl-tRNA formyltransferase
LRIAIASSSRVALPTIEAIENSEHELIGFITTPDAPAGRGRALTPNEFANWASNTGREIAKPIDFAEMTALVVEMDPDLIITIAYGKLIPEQLLSQVKYGWLNLHFSLLPKWRGAAPVQWALKSGDNTTGVTVFQLDKGMDTGPIYAIRELKISESATTDSLLTELSVLGSAAVLAAIDSILSNIAPVKQILAGSIAPKISKIDAAINWSLTCREVDSHIRAMVSKPGAWTRVGGVRLVINSARIINGEYRAGELSKIGNAIVIGTSDGAMELAEVTPEGKRVMSGAEWFRGARIEIGSICE